METTFQLEIVSNRLQTPTRPQSAPPTPPSFPGRLATFSVGRRSVALHHGTPWFTSTQPAWQPFTPSRLPFNNSASPILPTPHGEDLTGDASDGEDDSQFEAPRMSSPVPFDQDDDEPACNDDRLPPSSPIPEFQGDFEPPDLSHKRSYQDNVENDTPSSPALPVCSSPPPFPIPRQRSARTRPREKNERVLDEMRAHQVHPLQLLADILDPEVEYYERWWKQMLREDTKQVDRLLDMLWKHEAGRKRLREWFCPHAPEMVCTEIKKELQGTLEAYRFSTSRVTPDFLATWLPYEYDKNGNPRPFGHQHMPMWLKVLDAAIPPKAEDNSRDWELVSAKTLRQQEY
ncbi:hypothetical protein PM082_009385 [Marasmius tenuissimus]|nr:hypothetical protein PM082_009385 [Marasmius tenuissimus]